MSTKTTMSICKKRVLLEGFGAMTLAAALALGTSIPSLCATAYADEYSDSVSTVQAFFAGDSTSSSYSANEDQSTDALTSMIAMIEEDAEEQEAAEAQPAMEEVASKFIAHEAKEKTSTVQKTIKVAKSLQGTPYLYGGSTPSGFDCSGFTMYCYGKAGVKLTHNAQAQYNETKSVSTASMKAGDLVFFGSSTSSITHVGIYVGNGKFIHSPQTGETVRIDKLSDRDNFVGATRPVD